MSKSKLINDGRIFIAEEDLKYSVGDEVVVTGVLGTSSAEVGSVHTIVAINDYFGNPYALSDLTSPWVQEASIELRITTPVKTKVKSGGCHSKNISGKPVAKLLLTQGSHLITNAKGCRQFTREFKLAVLNAVNQGSSQAALEAHYSLSRSSIQYWRKQLNQGHFAESRAVSFSRQS